MASPDLTAILGPEVSDPEEDTFLLFCQPIPSRNLGFIDRTASSVEVSLCKRDLVIHQSPGLLSSPRAGGTTGAVIWKITPLFAEWMTSPTNFLFEQSILDHCSAVLELGCGVSGIVGLTLSPMIGQYIATDKEYVMRLLSRNISENTPQPPPSGRSRTKGRKLPPSKETLRAVPLDWETTTPTPSLLGLPTSSSSLDAVLALDCIYNPALIPPFVQTCRDACALRISQHERPTVCIIAQQLRAPEVFEDWLRSFHAIFHIWRVPDEMLSEELGGGSGFIVHLGVLRST